MEVGGAPGVPDLGVNASLNGRVPFPADNAWNTPVDTAPGGSQLRRAHRQHRARHEACTPTSAPRDRLRHSLHRGERHHAEGAGHLRLRRRERSRTVSDPANAPIEGGSGSSGDRHILIIDRDNWMLYELYAAYPGHAAAGRRAPAPSSTSTPTRSGPPAGPRPTPPGSRSFPGWCATTKWPMGRSDTRSDSPSSDPRRPTSTGPPLGELEHQSTRCPPMGMRVRLKASFDTVAATRRTPR